MFEKKSNTLHAFSMHRHVWMSEIAGHGGITHNYSEWSTPTVIVKTEEEW